MGSNIGNELDTLFEEWKKRLKTHFTKDGVMYQNDKTPEQVEQEWKDSSKRVVFLLKDQHQFDSVNWDEDIRYWLKDLPDDSSDTLENKRRNRNLLPPKFNNGKKASKSILKPMAYILWGLIKADRNNECLYQDVEKHHEDIKELINRQPFALMECKKDPGGDFCKNSVLKQHIDTYGDLLRKEIGILNPNMIICTNGIIYNFVLKMYPEDELTKIEGHNSIRYHKKTDTLIFCSYHPSARKNLGTIYDGVLNHYRAFLQSEHASQFLK